MVGSDVAITQQLQSKNFIVLLSAVVCFVCGCVVGTARILIDGCFQATLISDKFVNRLHLPVQKNANDTPVRGIGFSNIGVPQSCNLKVILRLKPFTIDICADVIPANVLPYSINCLSDMNVEWFKKFELADPAFYSPNSNIAKIDILLGAEYVEQCMINESATFGSLTLRSTQFGWTLIGAVPYTQSPPSVPHLCCLSMVNINDQLTRFWETESVLPTKPTIDDSVFCKRHFVENTTRATNGQFVMRLPFKSSPTVLATNGASATSLSLRSEARSQVDVRRAYSKFITEYEELGHMSKVEPSNNGYFLPHHAVLRRLV